MGRDVWDRLVGRRREAALSREAERQQMSPAERRRTGERVEDIQADEFVGEMLGGTPERLLDDDLPPRG